MGIRSTLGEQASNPHGPLGLVAAAVMRIPGVADIGCGALGDLLDLGPEDDLLDVACGSGLFVHRYGPRVRHIAGIDQSAIQIGMARRLNRDLIDAGRAEIVQGDATRMPWPDNSFDAVACNCIGCFVNPRSALAEMFRVLRPGGRLALSIDYSPDPGTAQRQEKNWGQSYWTEEQFRELVLGEGFTGIHTSREKKLVFLAAVRP